MNPTLSLYDIRNLPPWNGRACLSLTAKGGGLPKLNYLITTNNLPLATLYFNTELSPRIFQVTH